MRERIYDQGDHCLLKLTLIDKTSKIVMLVFSLRQFYVYNEIFILSIKFLYFEGN